LVREIANGITIPVLAIGGITPENVGDVIRAGASGAAVVSAICGAADPRAAAEALVQAMAEAWQERLVAKSGA
jgi:thiamine monophosphate synthase